MKAWLLALAIAFAAAPALAQSSEGYSALAFGAIVGGYSPLLSAQQKSVLTQLLAGHSAAVSHAGRIAVKADSIVCRASNVAIAAFGCDLTFGARKTHLSGRGGHELFATLGEVGVQPDGAAGTIYMSASKVRCTIDPAVVAQNAGGGANCTYAAGP